MNEWKGNEWIEMNEWLKVNAQRSEWTREPLYIFRFCLPVFWNGIITGIKCKPRAKF